MWSRHQAKTARGRHLGRMTITHIPTRGWCMRATGNVASAQAAKVDIDTNGKIPFMGGKDEVRGG